MCNLTKKEVEDLSENEPAKKRALELGLLRAKSYAVREELAAQLSGDRI